MRTSNRIIVGLSLALLLVANVVDKSHAFSVIQPSSTTISLRHHTTYPTYTRQHFISNKGYAIGYDVHHHQQQQQQHLTGTGAILPHLSNRKKATSPSSPSSSTSLSLSFDSGTVQTIVDSVFSPGGGPIPIVQAFGVNAFLFAVLQNKLMKLLTPSGFIHALFLGTMLWSTLGWKGWSVCVAYFLLGSAVTKIKMKEKEAKGIAEGRGGRRGPENVWGSAASALFCAVASTQVPSFLGIPSNVYAVGYISSLATKLADTFASEIGKAYGKHTFLITTFESVEPGTEGAISAEGSAAAVVGGLLLSLCGLAAGLISVQDVPLCVVAAFIATNVESLIGATFQGKDSFQWMTNEVVNFFNTSIGAVIAIVGKMILMTFNQ
jgi:uncharacterized protein (TIGR00297 family)